jgi:pathogenesis-related protein 1
MMIWARTGEPRNSGKTEDRKHGPKCPNLSGSLGQTSMTGTSVLFCLSPCGYESLSACVYRNMRRTLWLVILLAGTVRGQWRHFGEGHPSASLPRSILAAHNSVRTRVGQPPVTWSDQLAARAQDWADTLLARGQFAHRPNGKYGENLFEITGAAATPERVVSEWAAESRNYDYNSNSCRGVCGHYTQIIWGDTQEVGCAVARGRGREIWVCNYDPPGNWVGRRPY